MRSVLVAGWSVACYYLGYWWALRDLRRQAQRQRPPPPDNPRAPQLLTGGEPLPPPRVGSSHGWPRKED